MQIVSKIAFIRYVEQSVCIISRDYCRSIIKGFNQECIFMHRHDQAAFCSFFESKADIRNPSLQLCWQGLASLLAHEHSRFAICQWELSTPTDISIPLTRRLVLRALEAGNAYLRSRLLNWFVVHHPQRLKSSHLDIFSKCILFLFYALVLILSIYLFLSMFILVFCQFIDFLLFYCLGASLCCLFPVLRTFYDWIHIFPIIATRSHQVNRTFAIHPCSSADRT